MVLVIVGIMFSPRTYHSEAKLFVRVGRESVTLDPTATTGQTISVYESRENEINSVLEVLQSRIIAERVVDALSPEVILAMPAPKNAETQKAAANPGRPVKHTRLFGLSDHISLREKAILRLQDAISVWNSRKSSIITLTCKYGSPELAQRILQQMVDEFREQHLRINRTEGSHEFFSKQTELLREELEKANDELRRAKNEIGVISIEGKRQLLQEKISIIETTRLNTESEIASAEAEIASIRARMANTPERLVTQEVTGDFATSAADSTRRQLYDLRIREQDLLTRYKEVHPLVIAVRRQITEAEKILADVPSTTQQTSSTNPAYQQLELRLHSEETRAASLRGRVATLGEQQARLQEQLKALNGHAVLIEQLERQVDLAQTNYRAYAEKLEQARINRALEDQEISNVNVVQPASFIAKPIGPKKSLIFALGLFVATFSALGFPIGREYLVRQLQAARAAMQPAAHGTSTINGTNGAHTVNGGKSVNGNYGQHHQNGQHGPSPLSRV